MKPPRGALAVATAAVALTALAGGGTAATASKPVNTSPPTITGKAVVGNRLHAYAGTWQGTRPIKFTFLWRRCKGGRCGGIRGAFGEDYTVHAADVGYPRL